MTLVWTIHEDRAALNKVISSLNTVSLPIGGDFLPAIDNMYKCTYNQVVHIDWDYLKAATNLEKHKVDFADAATVLSDDLAITIRDEISGEERLATIGMDALGRVLVVIYTWRQDRIRIISARKAAPGERRRYEG